MYKRLWYVRFLFAVLLVPLGANTAKALELKVMTRNLYVGTDLDKPLSLSRSELPIAVAEAWTTFQSTKYVERMAAIAEEICSESPHLVGLQEVALLRSQSPGDSLNLFGSTPAEHIEADFLQTLLADLAALANLGSCGPGYYDHPGGSPVDSYWRHASGGTQADLLAFGSCGGGDKPGVRAAVTCRACSVHIPEQIYHRFRSKLTTHSAPN